MPTTTTPPVRIEQRPGADRVRAHTDPDVRARLDDEQRRRVADLEQAPSSEVEARIGELEREWDVERVLETNASALALTGLVLSVARSRRWLIVPFVVCGFLLQHALQGWCPPMAVLRRLGVRTRREIDAERQALVTLLATGHAPEVG
jgi:hypothetical protein